MYSQFIAGLLYWTQLVLAMWTYFNKLETECILGQTVGSFFAYETFCISKIKPTSLQLQNAEVNKL